MNIDEVFGRPFSSLPSEDEPQEDSFSQYKRKHDPKKGFGLPDGLVTTEIQSNVMIATSVSMARYQARHTYHLPATKLRGGRLDLSSELLTCMLSSCRRLSFTQRQVLLST